MNYYVFDEKPLGKIIWSIWLAYPDINVLAAAQFNPVTDHTTCHRLLFQAYKFAMHFRTSRCDVTDYASV